MPRLPDLQAQFIDYLTGKTDAFRQHVAEQGSVDVSTRLNIYQNAYQLRLKDALETDHEILGIYLGDELFDKMAAGYIATHPSQHISLRQFANNLPDYLASSPPFSDHPVLTEIAAFERRLLDVFDAAETDRLDISALQTLPPTDWPTMKLRFHASVQLFLADWNSVECWKAIKEQQHPPQAERQTDSNWLLWRGNERVSEFRPLDIEEFEYLSMLIGGESFADLCELILSRHDASEVSSIGLQYLSRWFEQGIISAIDAT
ncbi:MAG: DNA-binding domain-containing protein [Gammaproteobacteria bacterium]